MTPRPRAGWAPLRVVAAALVLAAPAAGVEFDSGLSTGISANSNVLGTRSSGEVGDLSWRLRPFVSLTSDRDDLVWSLRYEPDYQYFFDIEEERGWSHRVAGSVGWELSRNVSLTLSDRFARVRNLDDLETDIDGNIIDVPDTDFGAERTIRNDLSAAINWQLGPRQSFSLSGSHVFNDFEEDRRADTMLARLGASYTYRLDGRNSIGVGASVSQNWVDAFFDRPDRSTRFYNASLTWSHVVDQTMSFSISGGPTIVDPQDDFQVPDEITSAQFPATNVSGAGVQLLDVGSCPVVEGVPVQPVGGASGVLPCEPEGQSLNAVEQSVYLVGNEVDLPRVGPPPESEPSLTYFADMSITKRGDTWTASASYRRTAATSLSTFGSSTVADVVRFGASWRPRPRFEAGVTLGYVRRTQTSDIPFSAVALESAELDRCLDTLVLGPGGVLTALCTPVLGTFSGVARSTGFLQSASERESVQDQYIVDFRFRYRLRQNLTLVANVGYRVVESGGDLGRAFGSRDRIRAALGLRYRFDTLHF